MDCVTYFLQRQPSCKTQVGLVEGGNLRIYEGAVLFVDLLGISALTKARIDSVTKEDFAAFGNENQSNPRNQVFCAVLLSEFRKNLRSGVALELRISQLSDCAFVWSEDIDKVVEFSRALFWKNIYAGLLCRGGLSYGEIVEPKKEGKGIGDFVCGEAVTRSVELERTGKGSRIFIDRDIGGKMFSNTPASAFEPVSSAIDFKTVDEYLWFSLPPDGDISTAVPADHIMNIIKAAVHLQCSPHFRWNSISNDGRIQIGATIERMSMIAERFCKAKKIPFPDFPFVKADIYMEIGKIQDPSDRDGRKLHALEKLAQKYEREVFSA